MSAAVIRMNSASTSATPLSAATAATTMRHDVKARKCDVLIVTRLLEQRNSGFYSWVLHHRPILIAGFALQLHRLSMRRASIGIGPSLLARCQSGRIRQTLGHYQPLQRGEPMIVIT